MKIFPVFTKSACLQGLFSLLVGLLSLLSSCSKDRLDVENLTIYLPAGSLNYNSGEASFVTARSNVFSASGTSIPVLLTRPVNRNVQIMATIDTTLLAVYDRTNNTVSERFPLAAFSLENNGQVFIPAGELRSADSLRIGLGQVSELDFSKTYIVPIRLSSTDSDVPLSSNRSVMYVRVTFNPINTQFNGVPTNRIIPILINRTSTGDVVNGNVNLAAALNIPFAQSLTVALRDAPDLLDRYNQANGTRYVAFPANSYTFNPASVSIASGSLRAATPFALALRNTSGFLPGNSYLLPVEIVDEGPIAPHELRGLAYFSVEVQLQNIDPANPKPMGNRIDRTAWTAVASSTDSEFAPMGSPALIFDNDPATGWHSELVEEALPTVTLTIDMQRQHAVRGFTFTPKYWDYYGESFISAVTGMRVESSDDGVNWVSQGSYVGSMPGGAAADPDYKNISFFAAVRARYFRFIITNYGEYAAGFGELDAFD
ncbi:BT_3987 domain-containing protein [Sphingobacterium griseoflavum]|uniref:F5/8 type C domain-containing protein n=1 Tax=Sphingobacterium griseoflavum TaxID=1474952 RepID=A0ABQ3I212_9SPHI|nr:DUF1735 domain-containing protein [Sphingobacterium griseoflavum]GHE48678.1 hypothetical protein GCM10017764_34630 [Sphingobacterium griseoflavum]